MSSLTESLSQVIAVSGVRAAALIDIATGMVVRSAGETGRRFPGRGRQHAGEAGTARAMLGPSRPGGDLDEISLVAGAACTCPGCWTPVWERASSCFIGLGRTRGDIALASLRVGQLAPAVLA